ncbi:hypothetical protein V1286_001270 [Bradyrhizobium algeriense]|uniref:Uncharacterized protein n=1 Tax=Bradyrhizobium algeriense TaxID=634784 RepID=A0ABU8B5C5_9BRAD
MATKKTARGRKQDMPRVAGGQNYELDAVMCPAPSKG